MTGGSDSLSIKGTPLSGRPWKKDARPRRALSKSGGAHTAEERSRKKWEEAQALKNEMKEIAAEAEEAIKRAKERQMERNRKLRARRAKREANAIKSAGNDVVLVSNSGLHLVYIIHFFFREGRQDDQKGKAQAHQGDARDGKHPHAKALISVVAMCTT
ncbi:NADH:flavin oxidoreductase, putative [Babesia ovis]|uniref:NADH:flavin oxidoreductase, putative n=1 Tax=Babesia ovis TaxID=5869 RepID=A0A9W5WVV7_BABOV|nr:NADH:flavin oxidoreductase, putative [Babesia ovis]